MSLLPNDHLVFTMGNDRTYKARLGLHLKRSYTTIAQFTLLAYILLLGFVSDVSPQRTFQRACDCEYMVNGKCAYTLLLPTGSSNDATCPGAGAGGGSEVIDHMVQNLTNRVNNLYDIAINQSLLLNVVQNSIIDLQRMNQPSMLNDSIWRERQEATLTLLNVSLQSTSKGLDEVKMKTEMLALNLTNLADLFQRQMAKLSSLESVVNETKQALEKLTADDNSTISQLSETIRQLRQVSCIQRAALFSGPDKLNGTSIRFSSTYDANFGRQQLAIDNTATPGGWCPQEPPRNEWVQFDIGRAVQVFGIATRGRNEIDQWITTYSVQYIVPNNSSGVVQAPADDNNLNWVYFKDVAGANQVFQGNTDRLSIQLNMFWRPIFTRYVRLLPLTGQNGGNVCARADVIGCVDEI